MNNFFRNIVGKKIKEKKNILSIISVATIITLAVLPVSAHFVEADFNHHAHVYEGSPITPKKVDAYTTWKYEWHYTVAELQDRDGNVMSTSGRQYGDTKTNAYTEYYGLTIERQIV